MQGHQNLLWRKGLNNQKNLFQNTISIVSDKVLEKSVFKLNLA